MEKENKNNLNEYKRSGDDFLYYTKLRKELGLDKLVQKEKKSSIEYLQKNTSKYLDKESEEVKREKDSVFKTHYWDAPAEDLEKEENIAAEIYNKKRSNDWNEYGKYKEEIEKEKQNAKLKEEKKTLPKGVVICGGYIATEEYTNERRKKEGEDIIKMEEKEIYLTEEGYKNIEEQLKDLKINARTEIAERIKIAKSYGDLSENSEYDEAKAAQEANENKIAELEETLKNAKIIDEKDIDTETVQVGNTVYITGVETKKEHKYTIVGVAEASVLEGKISNESPLAKSLLGAKVGEIVKVEAPVGIVEYKIKKITL